PLPPESLFRRLPMVHAVAGRALRALLVLTCSGTLLAGSRARAHDWPQWLGPDRDGIWKESGLVEKFPQGGPQVLWRTPIGNGYSGPAVANGRVYLMDRENQTGPDGKQARSKKGSLLGKERVLCLDESTGKIIWKYEYDCPYRVSYPRGPRTTPLVH